MWVSIKQVVREFYVAVFMCAGLAVIASVQAAPVQAKNIDEGEWVLSEKGASITEHKGRTSLKLNRGFAILNGEPFNNGIISFDIMMKDQRGFAGVYFRWNNNNAEYFYVRPHMSGKPDSTQYTPRFNGLAGWQLYHGERYSAPTAYRFDEWMSVKLVIKDSKMDVYIDSEQPVLHVDSLMGPEEAGSVRFGGARQDFHISNVQVTHSDTVELVGTPRPRVEQPEDLLTKFTVGTTAVTGSTVEAQPWLDKTLLEGQVWRELVVDETGAVNLAQVSGRTRDVNTLFVKTKLIADADKTVRVRYGFSDRVTVFLNGHAIAHGDDSYMTRDYRYLGTVGLFDSVFLPLKAGENELVFAVTEGFGGWAIKAAMQPVAGVQVD